MTRKKLLVTMVTIGGVAAAVGAYPDENNILHWSGAAGVTLAHHPGNWNPGFRPEAHHNLSFGGPMPGQPIVVHRCSFDAPISAAHIPFVESLNFGSDSHAEILGDPQIQWIGDGPNLSTRMVSVGWGADAEFTDALSLRTDHVQVLWDSRMRVRNALVDIQDHLSVLGRFDVGEGGEVRVNAGDLLLDEGQVSIAGGQLSIAGDLVVRPAEPRGQDLHIRDAYSYDEIPGVLRVHGELTLEHPEDHFQQALLWLERSTLHVGALDLRGVDMAPEQGPPGAWFDSGRVIVDGGSMRLRPDHPFEIAPGGFSERDTRFTLQLVNGASLHHGHDVVISSGGPQDDRLGQLTISSTGPRRSSMACHNLQLGLLSRDNSQVIMSGGADMAVMEDARIGSGRFAEASMIMHGFPGVDLEPTASFFQDLRIGEDGASGELQISSGAAQVFGDLHLGRIKGNGVLLVSGHDGDQPTTMVVGGALYGAGPIDQVPENGRLEVRDGGRLQVNGPAVLGFGLELSVASGGELSIGGDTAIYNPGAMRLEGGTLSIGGAVTSEQDAISVPRLGYGGGHATVLRLTDGDLHGDLFVGDGLYGSKGRLEVMANDELTIHGVLRVGGKSGGRFTVERDASVVLSRNLSL
ncbi:MAG: hypothetical protein MK116_03760, partial [Phycisphaerales bacterium]|nr:hypothetical protein [Phycisphaerales bacterium]